METIDIPLIWLDDGNDVRLARAVDLMGRGLPLAEVAAEVGYAAPAAFSTMFKRALGVPPSRFTASPE